VVTGSDRRDFSKVQKRWLIAKKNFDRMDKALERELWRDGAVRAGVSNNENTSILRQKYSQCGSEPARECGVPVTINVD
jgi:hypothetical protein